jgi:hypothetical protein
MLAPDATMTISKDTFLRMTGRGLTFAKAIKSGAASASGDGDALRRLKSLFRLPPRIRGTIEHNAGRYWPQ